MKRPPLTFLKVAAIIGAHGIRGEVKLRSFTDPADAIFSHDLLFDAARRKKFRLHAQGGTDKALIAAIEGVSDRNAAEQLKGTELYAPVAAAAGVQPSLAGLEARLENGAVYGAVSAVHNYGAGDILDIARPDGTQEMLPINDRFVGEIKVKDGYLIVFPPDYIEGEEGA